MANRNKSRPDKNQRNERLRRRGEDIHGEGEPRYQDRVREDTGNYRTFGSPYDVGNYASHFDQRDHKLGDQTDGLHARTNYGN
jgi:hypothetical protein